MEGQQRVVHTDIIYAQLAILMARAAAQVRVALVARASPQVLSIFLWLEERLRFLQSSWIGQTAFVNLIVTNGTAWMSETAFVNIINVANGTAWMNETANRCL